MPRMHAEVPCNGRALEDRPTGLHASTGHSSEQALSLLACVLGCDRSTACMRLAIAGVRTLGATRLRPLGLCLHTTALSRRCDGIPSDRSWTWRCYGMPRKAGRLSALESKESISDSAGTCAQATNKLRCQSTGLKVAPAHQAHHSISSPPTSKCCSCTCTPGPTGILLS